MFLDLKMLAVIEQIQRGNPNFLLCGSAALILKDVLPSRDMHDIDFVTDQNSFLESNLRLVSDSGYPGQEHDEYNSYSCAHIVGPVMYDVNVLVFNDHIHLYHEECDILSLTKIRHQRIQDIINWKEKYNRSKDIKDLEKITIRAIEKALYEEKV